MRPAISQLDCEVVMRVLFVGNSYTMYHDVPAQVAALSKQLEWPFEHQMCAEGGASWRTHFEELGTTELIESTRPDVLVLQNRSTEPLLEVKDFHDFGKRLIKLGESVGSRIVLFKTWAWHEDNPVYGDRWSRGSPLGWLSAVQGEYGKLATETHSDLARVGEAWWRSITTHHEIRLHDDDNHHAAPNGAYLAACVLARTLTNKGVSSCTWKPDEVTEPHAAALRQVADSLPATW